MDNPHENSTNKQNFGLLIEKLKKVFEYYCQYGEKLNTIYLKSHKFIKFATECNILDNKINRTRLELIYKSENNKNQMNFKNFLNSLIKVAEYKFINQRNSNVGEINKTKCLNMLIEKYILPKYDELYPVKMIVLSSNEMSRNTENNRNINTSAFQSLNTKFNKSIITVPNIEENVFDKSVEEIFMQVAPILFDIYKVYFPHEISLSEDMNFLRHTSYKNYYIFLKEFDLYPGLISKPVAFHIYQSEENDETVLNQREYYLKLIKNIDLQNMFKYNSKNENILGRNFNFFKFLRVLLKIAEMGYEKLDKINYTSLNTAKNSSALTTQNECVIPIYEKLILTLERMELSEGFRNLEKKTSKTHSMKNISMITKSLLEKVKSSSVNTGVLNSFAFDCISRENFSTSNVLGGVLSTDDKTRILIYHNNFNEFCKFTSYLNENYGNELVHLFKAFCSFGDPMNTKYMKSQNFQKLLNEAKLISNKNNNSIYINTNTSRQSLSRSPSMKMKTRENIDRGLMVNDIDSIFIKLANLSNENSNANDNIITSTTLNYNSHYFSTSNIHASADSSLNFSLFNQHKTPYSGKGISSGAKIDYNAFLIGIEVIARTIYPSTDPRESIEIIVNQHLLKYLSQYLNKIKSSEDKIELLKEKQNNPDLIYVLGLVHKSFSSVYKYYANQQGLMNFEQFMKFAIDFGIFPDFLPKGKLNTFFKGVSQYIIQGSITDSNEFIEHSLFVDIIALCALELRFPDPQPSSIQRILFLVEKIAHSEGPKKILRSKGNTRLLGGENLNILDPFKLAFPDYFSVIVNKKDDFIDVISAEDY